MAVVLAGGGEVWWFCLGKVCEILSFGKDFGEGMVVHCRGMGERMPDGVQKKGVGSNCLAGESL